MAVERLELGKENKLRVKIGCNYYPNPIPALKRLECRLEWQTTATPEQTRLGPK